MAPRGVSFASGSQSMEVLSLSDQDQLPRLLAQAVPCHQNEKTKRKTFVMPELFVDEAAEDKITESARNQGAQVSAALAILSQMARVSHPLAGGSHENVARDTHDLMNIIVLPVVIAFVMNFLVNQTLDNFWALVAITMLYFMVDLVWVIMVPHSVKSPMVIKAHHTLTLMYMMLPCLYPEFGWGMASCLCVEINTWFLIARRYWRRSSILFSIGFYISWMVIRVVLYPYLVYVFFLEYLEKLFWQLDADASGAISGSELMRVSNWWHLVLMAPLLQIALTLLNIKWTFDLLKNNWAQVTRGQKKAHSL